MSFFNQLVTCVLSLSTASLTFDASAGTCDSWLPGPLWAQSQGINGIVECQTIWAPPGGPSLLVVGGSFTTAGGVAVNDIAGWDGATWRPLGLGTDGAVWCLGVYNGELIAGGVFTNAGGSPANFIARFDGTTWRPLGTGLGGSPSVQFPACRALTVFKGELIAGGTFAAAGGVTANHIARWNGSSWSALAGPAAVGVGGSPPENIDVRALTVLNNKLYVGGSFQTAASIPASNIASWSGSAWSTLGGSGKGVNNIVHALSQFNGELTVGGEFTQAITASGTISAVSVARWNTNTSTWEALGSGISGASVFALQNFNGGIIAGGWSHSGGPNLAFWNGSTWSLFNGGVSGPSTPLFLQVTSLSFFDGKVTVGGFFTGAGSPAVTATNLVQWSGTAWVPASKPAPRVLVMETLNSRIIAGGQFIHSTTNFAPTSGLIGWNGATLTNVGGGVSGGVSTVTALKTISGAGGSSLIVGGDFTFVGSPESGINASRIAIWDEPLLFAGSWSAMGAGFNGFPMAIERFNNVTYAGGTFTMTGTTPLNRIGQFNGTNWVSVGTGMNGNVSALKVYNGFLYAGGDFTTAGGASTGGLARWNGTSWSMVALPFNGVVFALEVHNNELVIGGQFTAAGSGAPNITKWNGSSFSSLGPGSAGANNFVSDLRSDGQSLYVGGGFTSVGGVAATRVAKWNTTNGWSALSTGVANFLDAMCLYRGELHVSEFGASPSPSWAWARYKADGVPWVASNPISRNIICHDNVTFTAQAAFGYPEVTATWHRNGVPLSDGPTGHHSTISGSHSTSLAFNHTDDADAGAYTCVFANSCGSVTTSAATLTVTECCDGDIVSDDQVDINDLVALITSWGACPAQPAHCIADVDGSGVVDINDLVLVITGWGACP